MKEYKESRRLNSSMIKEFIRSRYKFKSYFIDGVPVPEIRSSSTIIGSLTDFFLLWDRSRGTGNELFDDFFALYPDNPPSGQMADVVDELYNETLKNTDKDGKVTKSFEELLKAAHDKVAYDSNGNKVNLKKYKTYEGFLTAFKEQGLPFYTYLRNNIGKTTVTTKQLEIGEACAERGLNHWVTRDILKLRSNENTTVINQLKIFFTYKGFDCKAMLDKVIVSHKRKTIYPIDLKTTFSQDNFLRNFIHLCYYIQAAFYDEAIKSWALENGHGDYTIAPLEFIVIPTNFTEAPLRYRLSRDTLENIKGNFTFEGRPYKGLNPVLDEISWHIQTNEWAISKEDFDNRGVKYITI